MRKPSKPATCFVVPNIHRNVFWYDLRNVRNVSSPSTELLTLYAKALGVTTDVLAGLKAPSRELATEQPENLRLWRRLKRIEALPLHDRKALLKMTDAMTERSSRRKAS